MRLYKLDGSAPLPTVKFSDLPFKPDGYKSVMGSTSAKAGAPCEYPDGRTFKDDQGRTLVTIPSREVLAKRLDLLVGPLMVDYVSRKLFPELLKLSGEELFPIGVAVGIHLATHDALEGLPPYFWGLMNPNYPMIIATLVPDESLHEEILSVLGKE